jgi:hypothetical protein
MTSLYPPDLVPLVQSAWTTTYRMPGEKRPPLPAVQALTELLALAYHTSLLLEEGRKLLFRIIYLPRGSSKKVTEARRRNSRLAVFTEDRALNVAELRRLAPAADSTRTMICADHDSETGWRVWGLLDTGANWWQFTRHEASSGTPPPQDLAIGSPGPGELTVSSGGMVLLALRNGTAFLPQGSALDAGPVSTHLEPTRRQLYRDSVKRLKSKKWDEEGHDNDYPKRFHDMCLSRILSGIREIAHGGTLLVVPNQLSATDPRLADRVNIKHPCDYDYLWELMLQHLELHKNYYALHFPLWDSKAPIDPEKYQQISMLESTRIENDEALKDAVRFIASLSAVDGALVITDRFRVLGFGAEVTAQSPTLREVQIAGNPEATIRKTVSIEAYGTRHRSAFRFCSTYEDAIAFIVSSDGGVKATKRIGQDVLLWPEVQASFWGA